MTFRTRLLVTFLLAVLLPLIALALFVRDEMTDRLTAQYERRVESLVAVIEEDLAQESEAISTSLAVIRKAVVDDNRFRRAAVDRAQEERRYLLDYAGNAMQLTGLSMLQIQDEAGRIISSGHFRNEYDRMEPELPTLLASTPEGIALVQARAPDAPFLALARADSFQMGNKRFTIVAGLRVERRFLARLAREAELTVALVYPGGMLTSGMDRSESGDDVQPGVETLRDAAPASAIARELSVPFIDSKRGELALAQFRVTHRLTELEALRGSIDRWFLVAVAAAGILAVMLVGWLASRISRPLVELADKTSRIDLDRLDIDFETRRKDEIGSLSRLLGAMTERLRASAVRIKDAERRATLGELARQVNHDIKNGLTPIRNVFRHLIELARSNPKQLPDVFEERQSTLDSSISYLEDLASNYARLYPRSENRPCDVNDVVQRVATDLRGSSQVDLLMNLSNKAVVLGDPVSLRRVLENLVNNAIDSLESRPGNVAISTELVAGEADRPRVRITVADTGIGMSADQQAKVFDDFYTTKDNGSGLGLSIVRRLVMDLDGSIHVESEEGKGSRFIIDLPGAGTA
ncbi:MAG: HAMP domain-containing protein [Candidatus Latescibacteria bacterium]|nr:HAMP domain-containing protein [Candidatus Latescibacterota bacterium]NIO57374.1 HAMP domain-containing protein [Candidatus Latescibacterota bacterium]